MEKQLLLSETMMLIEKNAASPPNFPCFFGKIDKRIKIKPIKDQPFTIDF